MKRLLALAAVPVFFAAALAHAGNYEKAHDLFVAGKPEAAVAIFQEDAKKGVRESQFNLGLLYEAGQGVKKDEKEAFMWFKKAADQGLPIAQYVEALYYRQGKGGAKKSDKKAFGLLKKAAEGGEAAAMNNLGFMYANGYGTDKHPDAAFKWYKKSMDKGYEDAMCSVAQMYMEGIGTERDQRRATEMMIDGFTRGIPFCAELLQTYENDVTRNLAAMVMPPEALKAAKEEISGSVPAKGQKEVKDGIEQGARPAEAQKVDIKADPASGSPKGSLESEATSPPSPTPVNAEAGDKGAGGK